MTAKISCAASCRSDVISAMSTTWPLFDLRVTSPRLSLQYADDNLVEHIAELAAHGIHDKAAMPFSEPWTDVKPPELQRNTLRYYWRTRAETTADHWILAFAVRDQSGQAIGMCSLSATTFPTTRTASTGSWLGQRFQGQGLGREMREAALHLAFAGLGAHAATTRAWHDNVASLGVTRSLPYLKTGTVEELRRSEPTTMVEFEMTRPQWQTVERSDITLDGVDPVLTFLQIPRRD